MMQRKTAKKINLLLYVGLLMTIPIMIYLEVINDVPLEIILVCIMFAISMGLLWVSEQEDEGLKESRRRVNH
jgi:hypothetical protein